MTSPLTIEHSKQLGFNSRVKICLGQLASVFYRKRLVELSQSPKSQPNGWVDKALMSVLKQAAMREGDVQFFESLHRDFWQGEGGGVFSSNCDHRFHDLFLGRQQADIVALLQEWERSDLTQVVEFGCNSGLVLDYLCRHLTGVQQADGVEINQSQVEANKGAVNLDSKINFHCADGGQWLLENGKPSTLFVTNGGVLEYFRRERLDEMLTYIFSQLQPAMFFSIEPVAPDHDWSTTRQSVPFGEELSFSHNYTDLFESNGFEIVHQRSTDFESWRMMATIARTS
jgi:hypothetical protein